MDLGWSKAEKISPRTWDFWDETFIPKGCVILLAGQGGSGKSTFMSWLADTVVSDRCRVGIISNEEDKGLLAARCRKGSRVMLASSLYKGTTQRFTAQDVIGALADFEILFVDSLRTLTDCDLRRSENVEKVLLPLVNAVIETEKSIVLLTHTNKGGGETLQDMVAGSERLVSGVRHCNLTINDRVGDRRFVTVAKTNCMGGAVNTTYVINPMTLDIDGSKLTVVKDIAPFYDDIEQIIYNNSSKGKQQRYHKMLYGSDDVVEEKLPTVIRNLQNEFNLGEPFTIADVRLCGSLAPFYKYYNTHPEKFGTNKEPRNYKQGEKKKYWFK